MWKKIARNDNYSINENGEIRNDATGAIRTPTENKANGYLYVDLYKNNRHTKVPVNRIVAETFIPNPENKPTVDHKDGNRKNNAISNLRWATYSEQNSRFKTHGVRSQKVRAIRYHEERNKRGGGHMAWGEIKEVQYFDSIGDCSKFFNCTISSISQRLQSGEIGVRGRTRAWKIEYVNSKRSTYGKV